MINEQNETLRDELARHKVNIDKGKLNNLLVKIDKGLSREPE